MSSELESVEIEDQKKHPDCHYSRSFQTHCRYDGNVNACQDIQRVLRLCPGERPIEIYKKSDNTTNGEATSQFGENSLLEKFFDSGSSFNLDPFFKSSDVFEFDPFTAFNRKYRNYSLLEKELQSSERSHDQITRGPYHETPTVLSPPHRLPKGQRPMRAPSVDGYVTGPSENV